MDDLNNDDLQALVFKNRGLLLTLPAALLAAFGRPDATGVALGLPLAIAGELVRCWAVGYSGVTTRGDAVEAPQLVTAGPYAYVRNPLYVGNFMTALGFAVAFTGKNRIGAKLSADRRFACHDGRRVRNHRSRTKRNFCARSSARHSSAIANAFRR